MQLTGQVNKEFCGRRYLLNKHFLNESVCVVSMLSLFLFLTFSLFFFFLSPSNLSFRCNQSPDLSRFLFSFDLMLTWLSFLLPHLPSSFLFRFPLLTLSHPGPSPLPPLHFIYVLCVIYLILFLLIFLYSLSRFIINEERDKWKRATNSFTTKE